MVTYGWIPDIPDQRDIRYGAVLQVSATLPASVDLRSQCPPVEGRQANLRTCTVSAVLGAVQVLAMKYGLPWVSPSALFVYYNARLIEHAVGCDSGAMLRDVIKTLAKDGVCTENKWPYDAANFTKKPPASCYQEALRCRISQYQRIETLSEMKACLAESFPFVFGFTVYESFESQEVARAGVVPMPGTDEQMLGGHAVMAVGYDDGQKRFIVRSSFPESWGMQGYFTISYDYLLNRGFSDDFWTVRRCTGM